VLAFADGAEPHDDMTIIATRPAARAALAAPAAPQTLAAR
jgi:hypothetical protein